MKKRKVGKAFADLSRLEALGGFLMPSWGPLGAIVGAFGAPLGPSWGLWKPSRGHLEGRRSKGAARIASVRRSPTCRLFEPSWGALRMLLGLS